MEKTPLVLARTSLFIAVSGLLFPCLSARERLALSPFAVADSVKENSLAAKAGMKAGDVVVGLNGRKNPTLEEALAYRFDSSNTRETRLDVRRDGVSIAIVLPQGDWGCDLRPDFSPAALKGLAEAREALAKDEKGEAGRALWEALAREVAKGGFHDAASWLRCELGKALKDAHRPKEAAEALAPVVSALVPAGEGPGFWGFYATLKLADALAAEGEGEEAVRKFEEARALAKGSASDLRVAGALNSHSNFEYGRGRLSEAKALAEEALALREEAAPGTLAVAASLNNLSVLAEDLGDLEGAKTLGLRALAIKERLAPESMDVAASLNNLGTLFGYQGDLAAEKEFHLKALAILQRLAPESRDVAASLSNLGVVAGNLGDLATAREFCLRALAIRERLAPESREVAASLNNLGIVAHDQGDYAAAKEVYLRALAIRERLAPGSLDVAESLTNLGVVSRDLGDLAAARSYQERALTIKEAQAPGSLEVAGSLNNLGVAARAQGDLATAKEFQRRALAIEERLAPGSLDVAMGFTNLGVIAQDQGDFAAAKEDYLKALEIRKRLAPGGLEVAESLRGLADAERASGNLPRCEDLLAQAVDLLEAQRGRAGGESAKAFFLAAHRNYYTDLMAIQMAEKEPEKALETLERSRARALLEMVSSRFIDLKGEVPAGLLARQRDLARQRKALADKLAGADATTDPQDVDLWRSELLMLPQKEDVLAEEIRKASPRLASLEYPKPLNFRGIAGALEPGSLVVAYSVAENETLLFTLLKGKGGDDFHARRLPFGRKDLDRRVRAFRSLLGPEAAEGADPAAWKGPAQSLFRDLLGPASKGLAACERIVLLPDGPLHVLPFAALLPSGRDLPKGLITEPLGLQKPISAEASVTVLAELKAHPRPAEPAQSSNPRPNRTWTGFGDPLSSDKGKGGGEGPASAARDRGLGSLPGTRKEIEAIAALFGSDARTFLGADATEDAVRSLPRETPYLHFACHGLIDPLFPMNSALALSAPPPDPKDPAAPGENRKDGLLQAWEIIQDVKLDSDCVVLSACETGAGKVLGGEGILGLTRAFYYAGARSLVVSLWPISDESTVLLMKAFYREILSGAPRDVALMRAQAALAKEKRYSHPFYWAAFILNGDGR